MARINLLPWREELRQEKKKEFLVQLGGVAVLVALCSFLWVQSVDASIESQKTRNRMLDVEIQNLKKQVEEIKELKDKKKELESRMRVIQDLEGKRSVIVHYFDEMAIAVPDGIYLTSIRRTGSTFALEGVSESNQRISEFMRQLDKSKWFAHPNLKSVVSNPQLGGQAGEFQMSLSAVLPDGKKEDK